MDRVARRFGYRVFPEWVLHPSQVEEIDSSEESAVVSAVSEEARTYLRRDHFRLDELRRLYAGLAEEVRTPLVWTEKFAAEAPLEYFRGDSMWVHQRGDAYLQERAYLLTTYYLLVNDHLHLLDKLTEDGAFGAVTFEVAGRRVSRDLLDSILEIGFLDRNLKIAANPELSILDVGAGYGRLAHRMLTAFPSLRRYRCTDVIPESSFVCEYYLKFRGHEGRFQVTPSTQIDDALRNDTTDLALNIHSFSECTLDAVNWWLERLARHGVRYLMIVPNAGNHGGQLLRNNVGQDMLPVVQRNGYGLIARESKFADPEVQKFGLNPTWYWLFELGAGASIQ